MLMPTVFVYHGDVPNECIMFFFREVLVVIMLMAWSVFVVFLLMLIPTLL